MKLRASRGLLLAFLISLQVLLLGGTALAYDPDNSVPNPNYSPQCYNGTEANSVICRTDNGAISVFMESSVSSNMRGRIRDALDNSYDPISNLSITYAGSPVKSGAGETDIMYQQGSIPFAGAIGITWCDDAVDDANYSCDQQYVKFVSRADYERRYLACHETGHAVGLVHGQDAYPRTDPDASKLHCMRAQFAPDDYGLGSNNVALLHDMY